MDIIVTLAGKSSRFKEKGYKLPKFLLPIGKSIVLEQVLNQFDDKDNFHLVYSSSQSKNIPNLKKKFLNLKKNINLYVVDDHDYGPVYSALQATNINKDSEVIVTYCDFLVSWDYNKFKRICKGYDSSLITFRNFHPSSFSGTLYCYLKNSKNLVTKISEKKSFTNKPHEEPAATGIHYFSSNDLFRKYSEKVLKSKSLKKKYRELYMSLPYIYLLKDNKSVLNYEAENFISLGTPKDYEEFISWRNYFINNEKN